jgi:predicted enzyme related to lactoylglutathione lyase
MKARILLIGIGAAAWAATTGAAQDAPRISYRPSVVLQLAVSDLGRAIAFYQAVLEFRLTERRDDLGFAHIATNVPGLELGLSTGAQTTGNGASIVNIGVADVAAARALLEKRGVVFRRPTQIIPGKVALAEFADPDGNRLRLAGPPPK